MSIGQTPPRRRQVNHPWRQVRQRPLPSERASSGKFKNAKRVHPGPWPVKQLSFIFNKVRDKARQIRAWLGDLLHKMAEFERLSIRAIWLTTMHDVILYTRQGCHLCEEALAVLRRHRLSPRVVDIDADETLRQRYNECVPVVEIDGK